jgi:hypothetical protein
MLVHFLNEAVFTRLLRFYSRHKMESNCGPWNPIVYLNCGIQLCTLTKKTWSWTLDSMCSMCQPRKKQVPGWAPIVYLNEKNMDLEVGIDVRCASPEKNQVPCWNPIVYLNEKNMELEVGFDVYDVQAPKKIRFLVGIQLCTSTKKTWISKLESMCTMCQPRKKSGSWLGFNCVP